MGIDHEAVNEELAGIIEESDGASGEEPQVKAPPAVFTKTEGIRKNHPNMSSGPQSLNQRLSLAGAPSYPEGYDAEKLRCQVLAV